eukprot:12760956-Alexandrium_andersonii.AAC.1
MDAFLLVPVALFMVLCEEGARDGPANLWREGIVRADAQPLVDVASSPSSSFRPEFLDVMEPSRIHNGDMFVRWRGSRAILRIAEDIIWCHMDLCNEVATGTSRRVLRLRRGGMAGIARRGGRCSPR